MREIFQVLPLPMMGPQPWIGRHIGDRVLAGKIWRLADAVIDDAVDAVRLIRITVDGILDLLWRVTAEMMGLAKHRPHARHLEHQPLEYIVAAAGLLRHETSSSLFRQVHKDGARFKDSDWFAVRSLVIDQCRNAVVGAYLKKVRPELFTLADIDRNDVVRPSQLFEQDRNL